VLAGPKLTSTVGRRNEIPVAGKSPTYRDPQP